ncbi:hypothetical protein [Cytobacillus sp. IB215316]|uniref:hypothetical protein n=1 Tax=Cytobacillus sp. IB215316 TaxID=3097354 RepID=UPI002A148D30|nr:hypothetical protein [Cytobacillus sp. IB215316]MDX8363171.1 hypothetical protein [Cytobacillus sp. IB215316]
MKKLIYTPIIFFVLITAACSNNEVIESEPPIALIEINNKQYETILGSYCWKTSKSSNICVDTAGPVEILEGETPIEVRSGEVVKFVMHYEPKRTKIHVTQIEGVKTSDVIVENNTFFAPMDKGIYYYSYGVWWMDKENTNVSDGDALYNFVLEVK